MDQIVLQLNKLQAGGTHLKGVSKGLWGCVDEVFPSQPPPPPTLPQTYTQNPGYSKTPPTKK